MTHDEIRAFNVKIAFTLFEPTPTGSKTIASIPTGENGTATQYMFLMQVPGEKYPRKQPFYDKKCWCDWGLMAFHSDWNWFMAAYKVASDFLQNLERSSQNHCCGGDWLEVEVQCQVREFNLEKAYLGLIKLVEWIKQYKDENNSTKPEPSAPECDSK